MTGYRCKDYSEEILLDVFNEKLKGMQPPLTPDLLLLDFPEPDRL